MTPSELIQAVRGMCKALAKPLPAEEYAAGWSEKSRLDMLRFFEKLENDPRSGADIPYFSIGRALDHYGVGAGNLLEEACRISNALNDRNKTSS